MKVLLRLTSLILIVIAAIVCVVLGAYWLIAQPAKKELLDFAMGSRGGADLALSAATLIAGIITIYFLARRSDADGKQIELARKSFQQSQLAELAGRYQKGIDLLGSEKEIARIGGIYLLRDLAAEAPELYHNPVIEMLAKLVADRSRPIAQLADDYLTDMVLALPEALPVPQLETPDDVRAALRVIGTQRRHPNVERFEEDALKRHPLRIPVLVLCGQFEGLYLSNFELERVIVQGATLERCVFRDAEVHLFVSPPANRVQSDVLSFEDCDFRGAAAFIHSAFGLEVDPLVSKCDLTDARLFASQYVQPRFSYCDVDTCSITASEVDLATCWYTNSHPKILPAGAGTEAFPTEDRLKMNVTERGMRLYRRPGEITL